MPKRLVIRSPRERARRHLNTALDMLGEARFLLDHGTGRADQHRVFQLLAGIQAKCEIVKLAMSPWR